MGNLFSVQSLKTINLDDDEAVFEVLISVIQFDSFARAIVDGYEESLPPRKKPRGFYGRCKDVWDTNWGKMLRNPDVKDPTSRIGRLFRRRFRVDYELFDDLLVPICKENNVFEQTITSSIAVEFKILISLRILGRDNDCDTIPNCHRLESLRAMRSSKSSSVTFQSTVSKNT